MLHDGLLQKQTAGSVRSVFAPKVAGALRLAAATANTALSCFAAFSSVAAAIGSAGQGSYAAANAAMDALSVFRQAAGHVGVQ